MGISIVQDYGCSWDEDQQMKHGKISAKEICKQFNLDCPKLERDKSLVELQDYEQKYYGTFFQLVAIGIDTILNREKFYQKIHTRHYLGFCIFFLSALCFYLLLITRFSLSLSLIGLIMYTTTPRIFAHSFFNPKDTIFLSFFVIALYALSRFLIKSNHKNLLLLSLSSALMLNARILGLLFVVITFATLFLYRKTFVKNIKWMVLYLIETLVFLFLIWPLLWTNTLANLKETFSLFSQYPWKGELLYWGSYISSFELPWHYIPSWILITTPIIFLICILTGLVLIVIQLIKNYRRWFEEYTITLDGITLAATLGPLIAIVVFNSVVYGGWRHLFFIHAGLTYLSVFALNKFIQFFPRRRKAILIAASIGIAINLFQVIRMHPQQHVYFNPIAGETLERFEQDYWGLSTLAGMEKLLEILPQDRQSKVFAYDFPAWCNYMMLHPDKERLEFVWDREKADYFIDNFRRKEHIEGFLNKTGMYAEPLHIVYVQGSPVVGIFKIK